MICNSTCWLEWHSGPRLSADVLAISIDDDAQPTNFSRHQLRLMLLKHKSVLHLCCAIAVCSEVCVTLVRRLR
jgi:hypothetical protein